LLCAPPHLRASRESESGMAGMAVHRAMWVDKRARTLAFWLLALLVAASIGVLGATKPAHADTFTVNSFADSADFELDGTCDSNAGVAVSCTLRAAIQEANANDNAPTVDLISFNIPGDGPHTISPGFLVSEDLPTISDPVTIDGYTQGEATTTTTDDAKENTLAFGTDAVLKIVISGASAPLGSNGLTVESGGTTIRGLVISGFQRSGFVGGHGIFFSDTAGNTNNRVEGNFIGTNQTGTTAAQNVSEGVRAEGPGTGKNTIGGTTPASRNLISGNGRIGVALSSSDANTVRGNLIGTRANGTDPLGNGSQGILLSGDADNNLISENVIAFNDFSGVGILSSTAVGNRILTNSIFSTNGIGINFGNAIVGREQDNKDPDTGANNLQNYPIITSATSSGTATTITGTLNSKPRKTFTIQLFSNPAGTDEGKTFLGQVQKKTNLKGKASFSFFGPAAAQGEAMTATATGAEGTSEFSDEVSVGAAS
jgi:CSLREA domain-containing protein